MNQLEIWARGDALQGKVMLCAGVILVVVLFFIVRGNNPILRGMVIPFSILALVYLGYGGFLASQRPPHIEKTKLLFQEDQTAAIDKELAKATQDNRNYTMAKPIWCVLIAVSMALFFIFSRDYLKGLTLGLIVLFLGVLFLDVFLHQRLQPYLETLQSIASA